MPALIGWLLHGIGAALVTWVGRVLLSFGVAVTTYSVAVPEMLGYIQGQFAGVPADIVSMLAYMNVDKFMTLILSALAVRWASAVHLKKRRNAE